MCVQRYKEQIKKQFVYTIYLYPIYPQYKKGCDILPTYVGVPTDRPRLRSKEVLDRDRPTERKGEGTKNKEEEQAPNQKQEKRKETEQTAKTTKQEENNERQNKKEKEKNYAFRY